MLQIGLGGGIGSGKSACAAALKVLGARVIDYDQLARQAVVPGSAAWQKIVDRWGKDIIGADDSLNRAALAERVFNSAVELAELNSFIHPEIYRLASAQLHQLPENSIVIHDIPLLYESDLALRTHANIILQAEENIRIQRLVENRHFTVEAAQKRISSQVSAEKLAEIADVLIDNNAAATELAEIAGQLWREWLLPFAKNWENQERSFAPRGKISPCVRFFENLPLIVRRLQKLGLAAQILADSSEEKVIQIEKGNMADRDFCRALRESGLLLERGEIKAANPWCTVVFQIAEKK